MDREDFDDRLEHSSDYDDLKLRHKEQLYRKIVLAKQNLVSP